MTATYLVTLDQSDVDDRGVIANDIAESLMTDGFEVVKVNPWQEHKPDVPTLTPGPLDQASLNLF